MTEYISKQDVIDYLSRYLNSLGECGADSLLFDRGQRRALINSIQDISAVKAANVQPVKHGRWIGIGEVFSEDWVCSVCGNFHGKANSSNFCSFCGARMDGVEHED